MYYNGSRKLDAEKAQNKVTRVATSSIGLSDTGRGVFRQGGTPHLSSLPGLGIRWTTERAQLPTESSPYNGIVFPSRSYISCKKKGEKSILELAHLVPW
jgi:hypothetical protein